MRRNVPFNAVFGLMICLLMAGCAAVQAAEENRFKGWIEENVFYRFDNQTGEIFKLIKPATGSAMWVKCDIVEPKFNQAAKTPALSALSTVPVAAKVVTTVPVRPIYNPQPGSLIEPEAMSTIIADQPAPKAPATGARQIEVFDEFGNNITNKIDDSDRASNRATINGYDALHVSHTLKTTGDRISGIIILDNKGNRKIAMLELTMTVRVIGKDKPIEHKRFIFADKPDGDKPPVPSFGSSGMSVLKKVDVPTPAGVINGMPEVRITYLRFDDKE